MDFGKLVKKPSIEIVALFVTLFLFIVADRLVPDDGGLLSAIPLALGALVVLEMLFIVGMEVRVNTKKHGWKHEVIDTIVALAVALGLWFSAVFLLNTSSPISGVVSCSMLPNLYRGDFVVVQGAEPAGYEISMSSEDFGKFQREYSLVSGNGLDYTVPGSLYGYCATLPSNDMCSGFRSDPGTFTETRGPLVYHYAACPYIFDNGTISSMPCVESVEYGGVRYATNLSNDVIVYQPVAGDYYSRVGDIVHRVFFKIDVDGEKYYLTRGDNNPVLDVQAFDYRGMVGNHPVPLENVRGKVIARVPILGYFKLLISGFWKEDEQCKWQLDYPRLE